jgi:hypothetical protein
MVASLMLAILVPRDEKKSKPSLGDNTGPHRPLLRCVASKFDRLPPNSPSKDNLEAKPVHVQPVDKNAHRKFNFVPRDGRLSTAMANPTPKVLGQAEGNIDATLGRKCEPKPEAWTSVVKDGQDISEFLIEYYKSYWDTIRSLKK